MKYLYLKSLVFVVIILFFTQDLLGQTIVKNEFLGTINVIVQDGGTTSATPVLTIDDTWGYTATVSNGQIRTVDAAFPGDDGTFGITPNSAPNSLMIRDWWATGEIVEFDNVNISSYTNVQFSIAYAGENIGGGDNLILEYSYDNGTTWETPITLLSNNAAFGPLYTLNMNDGAGPGVDGLSEFKFRVYTSGNTGGDRFYIDDVIISGTPPPNPTALDDDLTVTINSSSGVDNQIDVSLNDAIGSDGGDGDDFTLTSSSPTANGGAITEVSDGVFEYIPATGFIGADSFTYNICDANDDCDSGLVNVLVGFNHCIPPHPTNGELYITNVTSTGESSTFINNTTGDNGGYGDFTGAVAAIDYYKGNTYPVDISVFRAQPWYRMGWTIYIDLNADGDFEDAGEMIYNTIDSGGGIGRTEPIPFASQNITIPTSAITGLTVMRIGTRRWWSSGEPCGQTTSSEPEEFEDYLVDIQDPTVSTEISITGQGNVILSGTTTVDINNNTEFGTYDINSIPLEKDFVITNNNATALTLTLPIANPSGVFTISDQPDNAVIAPGNSETFTVAFNPIAEVSYMATVSVISDDATNPTYTFNVEGEGDQTFPDTDGDGVPDNIDGDDDNDGILDSQEQLLCISSPTGTTTDVIFLNEDFGAGITRETISGATYCFEDGTGSCGGNINLNDGSYVAYYRAADDDGVNDTPNGEVASWADEFWYPGLDHTPGDTNGRMAMFNADGVPGAIFYETTINGVTAGVDVTFGFSIINLDRADAPGIASRVRPSVSIQIIDPTNTIIASESSGDIEPTANYVNGDWEDVSATFNTLFTQFTVRLISDSGAGLGNDLAIDDIFVQQTLCDIDEDGVADSVDLDNDDDGIPNVVELGFSDTDKDGTLFGTGWVDVDTNGVHDSYETPITVFVDSDSDGVPDYLDADSDNDGIFDAVEFDGKGDVDIDGDGLGDGDDGEDFISIINNDDADGDGILPIVDTNDDDADGSDFGTSYPDPLDDDGDGIPNYRDVDSADNPNNFSNGSDIDNTQIYAYLDADDDGDIDGTVDTDGDGILDIFDTDNTVFGSPRDLNDSYTLFFDGRNDYVEDTNVITSGDATLMAWIQTDGVNNLGDNQIIAGQSNFYLMYDGSVINVVLNGVTITTSTTSPTDNIWIHAALTTQSGETILYINGIEEATSTTGVVNADTSTFTIGRSADTDANYFKGSIDEVRLFGYALTEEEVQRMIYQELSTAERGEIIPLDISTTLPGTLSRYYKMDTYVGDITSNLSSGGKIYNIKDVYFQTAPLPYETIADGDWTDSATWLHGDVWDITTKQNNADDISIVHIKNDINLNGSYDTQGMVGLIVDSGNEFTIEADKGLYNNWYLKLDGLIDLEGESQLVQTEGSILDATSAGSLERDQQGNGNTYLYNYWCSPVGITNATTNNNNYTLANVVNNVAFTSSGYNGIASPVTNADYWIWKYANNISDTYSEWQHIRSTGTLLTGEGFTMKGPGVATPEQNYVFVGKPNNEDASSPIALSITAGNDYLIGNPFPSSIDADEFILDNIGTADGGRNTTGNVINGALYFWDHFANNTHNLAEYEGGYATYTLMGGLPAVSTDARINASGAVGVKIPERYIPVGQGFFVSAILDASLVGATNDPGLTQPIIGGDIVIKNSQRAFQIETPSSSVFLKTKNQKTNSLSSKVSEDAREKIRLMFNSPDGYHRQLLVGADSRATNHYDLGFEAALNEVNSEDMFWLLSDQALVIQAINEFNQAQILPLGVKTKNGGIIEINIDALENILDDTQIYLKDKNTNTFHDLRLSSFKTTVLAGEINDRFELAFSNQTLSIENPAIENELLVYYNQSIKSISIFNPKKHQIDKVEVINTLGQIIIEEELNASNGNISIPIDVQHGVYIFKITSDDFEITKKSIISD